MSIRTLSPLACSAVLLLLLGACAKSTVQTHSEVSHSGLPRPERVLVYDFAVSADDVKQNAGFFARLARETEDGNQTAEQLKIGREVADALAAELTLQIQALGLNALRSTANMPVTRDSILITGRFLDIDEGNRLRRTVIGLGAGQSSLDSAVSVLAPASSGYRELISFNAHADSGHMPGAAVLGPAGAAAGAGTAAVVATNATMGAVKNYRSAAAQQARQIADKIVAELSRYFARQGWISPNLAK
jgi:hypothetical protein